MTKERAYREALERIVATDNDSDEYPVTNAQISMREIAAAALASPDEPAAAIDPRFAKLSMAMGNPALDWTAQSSIEDALVEETCRRLAENRGR